MLYQLSVLGISFDYFSFFLPNGKLNILKFYLFHCGKKKEKRINASCINNHWKISLENIGENIAHVNKNCLA